MTEKADGWTDGLVQMARSCQTCTGFWAALEDVRRSIQRTGHVCEAVVHSTDAAPAVHRTLAVHPSDSPQLSGHSVLLRGLQKCSQRTCARSLSCHGQCRTEAGEPVRDRGRCSLSYHRTQPTAPPPTLQEAQTNALLTLLNLNNPIEPPSNPLTNPPKHGAPAKTPVANGPPVWKVLVLDQHTKDVLATVLRVQDLRDVGVTLHVYVHSYIKIHREHIILRGLQTTPL